MNTLEILCSFGWASPLSPLDASFFMFGRTSPEDPSKHTDFAKDLQRLISGTVGLENCDDLFWKVDKLVFAEVQFYYARRRNGRRLGETLKILTWLTGLSGVVLPQIAAYNPEASGFRLLGSISLALAAAFGTANSAFGGTTSHIRATTAQLALEFEMTTYRLKWAHLVSTFEKYSLSDFQDAAFLLISQYYQSTWRTVTSETQEWGKLTMEAAKTTSSLRKPEGATKPSTRGKTRT